MHRFACLHPHRLVVPLLGLLASLSGFAAAATAGEPPTPPILRIDPGEHTAVIRQIATDASGRGLVTSSEDKTARVWDLQTGRLLATLRPPQGTGNEGKLFAVAMSPDGETVAVGGWLRLRHEGTGMGNNILLFDRASGRLLRRIAGLPNNIHHLAFAADGRTLAASMGGDNGIRLYDPASGGLMAEDRDYGADSYSVEFTQERSADGHRLVTTSYDGQVRLYRWADGRENEGSAPRLTLLVKARAPGGARPFAARFSPRMGPRQLDGQPGQFIAVGFDDTSAVNVLDSEDLRLLATPNTEGMKGNMSSVAWQRAPSGAVWLAAAGTAHDANGQHFIRRWPQQGGLAR